MTVADLDRTDDASVRARLIIAADREVEERGVHGLRMELIARRAGVHRATAFRQLGSVSEALVQVALLHAERHVAAVRQLMDAKHGTFAKIEAGFVYTTRELPTDPAIVALIARHSASVRHPRVHQTAMEVMGPVLEDGQARGEIRTDVPVDELVDYTVEQLYLATEDADRSDAAARKRFRQFIIAVLEARNGTGGEVLSWVHDVEQAMSSVSEALGNLHQWLGRRDPR